MGGLCPSLLKVGGASAPLAPPSAATGTISESKKEVLIFMRPTILKVLIVAMFQLDNVRLS